jgi:hypothetical protein
MTHLITSTPGERARKQVERAFRAFIEANLCHVERWHVFYEHGQWWAHVTFADRPHHEDQPEITYSAVDAEPTEHGIDFEEL